MTLNYLVQENLIIFVHNSAFISRAAGKLQAASVEATARKIAPCIASVARIPTKSKGASTSPEAIVNMVSPSADV